MCRQPALPSAGPALLFPSTNAFPAAAWPLPAIVTRSRLVVVGQFNSASTRNGHPGAGATLTLIWTVDRNSAVQPRLEAPRPSVVPLNRPALGACGQGLRQRASSSIALCFGSRRHSPIDGRVQPGGDGAGIKRFRHPGQPDVGFLAVCGQVRVKVTDQRRYCRRVPPYQAL